MSFQDKIKTFAPGYMLGRNAGRLLESVGATLDAYAERSLLGMFASDVARCEPDVLPFHARDRQITLYATEPLESQRYRLSRWRQIQKRRGTHFGEMENLQPYFLPGVLPKIRIVHQSNGDTPVATWWTLNADGTREVYRADPSNWDWDGVAAKWARFWVILYTDGTALDGTWAEYDDGTLYDDGVTVYDGISEAVIADLVGMTDDPSSAHGKLWGFALATDPASFSPTSTATTDAEGWTTLPTGNWGRLVDGSADPTRLPSAEWIYDLGEG